MESNVLSAFALTLFAGLSTSLGALVVFFSRKPKTSLLSFGLGFSGGVMVYISLMELLPEGMNQLGVGFSGKTGEWLGLACFFGGTALSALIDKLVPDKENPHEAIPVSEVKRARNQQAPTAAREEKLIRVGLLTALVIGLHNLPEGMATFATALTDPSLGISVAVAVAIHNIPEGVSVAVPIYFATRSRSKAFWYALGSGLAEPLGAGIVFLVLMPIMSEALIGGMLAAVAGIMVFISFDELLPTAREYGHGHTAIVGVVLGMAVMAVSLLLL